MTKDLPLIEKALRQFLPSNQIHPCQIHEAMRYAVLDGGKRFRPLLVLGACEAVGGKLKQALLPACAVEFIHAYSLVHDDLPALDNDEMRRGKPTCHRQFGEALAILAGDALLTRAFELLSRFDPPEKAILLTRELSEAAGTNGMIGGQVADILFAQNGHRQTLTPSSLDEISQNKTGRLIEASAVLGALVGTSSSSKLRRIRRFGQTLGLAFQVVDDIMDGDGYLRMMNRQKARQKAEALLQKARKESEFFGARAERLLGFVRFLSQTAAQNVHDLSVAS